MRFNKLFVMIKTTINSKWFYSILKIRQNCEEEEENIEKFDKSCQWIIEKFLFFRLVLSFVFCKFNIESVHIFSNGYSHSLNFNKAQFHLSTALFETFEAQNIKQIEKSVIKGKYGKIGSTLWINQNIFIFEKK